MAYSLALGTISFLLSVIWGSPLINLLRRWRIGKQIRIEEPSMHQVKMGTPTMGGVMMIVPVLVITGVLNIANFMGQTLIGRSILGAIDDLTGVRRVPSGMLARYKFLWQVIFAGITALALHFILDLRSVAVPGVVEKIDIGLWYIPVATFIIVGTSNSVNFADGLDALAGSLAAIAFAAYGVIAFLQGQVWLVAF